MKNYLSILILLCTLSTPIMVSASNTDGTIDSSNKYAWSERVGWINFGVVSGNVHVTDSQLTGYAWSENTGWIHLDPSVSNYVHNDTNGTLSGYAWGEGIGYIDFTGVTIDSSGYFHGYASSTLSGRISFNCTNTSSCGSSQFAVRTDWRPANTRTSPPIVISSGGGGGGGGSVTFGLPSVGSATSSGLIIHNSMTTHSLGIVDAFPLPHTYSDIGSARTCTPYLTKYIKLGKKNDQNEVFKLQAFLRTHGAPDLATTSRYDAQTRLAVLQFQTTYAEDIMGPWNTKAPTGYVFKTTLKKINQLYCTQQVKVTKP